jgi:hypothetical protein
MMEIPKPNFLHRLQGLDDGTKQKIIMVATIIIMVIVISLWMAYFNSITVGGGGK